MALARNWGKSAACRDGWRRTKTTPTLAQNAFLLNGLSKLLREVGRDRVNRKGQLASSSTALGNLEQLDCWQSRGLVRYHHPSLCPFPFSQPCWQVHHFSRHSFPTCPVSPGRLQNSNYSPQSTMHLRPWSLKALKQGGKATVAKEALLFGPSPAYTHVISGQSHWKGRVKGTGERGLRQGLA